jgi:hypothetical protein
MNIDETVLSEEMQDFQKVLQLEGGLDLFCKRDSEEGDEYVVYDSCQGRIIRRLEKGMRYIGRTTGYGNFAMFRKGKIITTYDHKTDRTHSHESINLTGNGRRFSRPIEVSRMQLGQPSGPSSGRYGDDMSKRTYK